MAEFECHSDHMNVLLIPLNISQRNRLIKLIAHLTPTIKSRHILLADSGLEMFASKLSFDGTGEQFAKQLVHILQRHGTFGDTNEPALVFIIRELQKLVSGSEDNRAFVESILKITPKLAIPPQDITEPRWQYTAIAVLFAITLVTVILTMEQSVRDYKVDNFVEPMPAGFNVLIVGFGEITQTGIPRASQDATEVSALLATRLERTISLHMDGLSDTAHVRYIEETELLHTTDPQKMQDIVYNLQQTHNANVVIYGVVKPQEGNNFGSFQPILFVNYRGFARESDVLDGENALGKPFLVPLPFNAETLQGSSANELEFRAEVLALLIMGLSFESQNDYKQALNFYERAIVLPGWENSQAGIEIAYLLAGNAYAQMIPFAEPRNEEYRFLLRKAEDLYTQALDSNPNYGRALIGLSGLAYLQAVDMFELGHINPGNMKLEQSTMLINSALNTIETLPDKTLASKAHFLKGQILLLRFFGHSSDLTTLRHAEEEFLSVINFYEKSDALYKEHIREYAAHAYGRLGLIAQQRDQDDLAVTEYVRAAELGSPYNEAQYICLSGQILFEQRRKDLAETTWQEARAILDFHRLSTPPDCHILGAHFSITQELATVTPAMVTEETYEIISPAPASSSSSETEIIFQGAIVRTFINCGQTQIIGIVSDEFGNPVTGVTIRVWIPGSAYDVTTTSGSYVRATTNASGWDMFLANGLRGGDWHVAVVDGSGNLISNEMVVQTDDHCDADSSNVVQISFQRVGNEVTRIPPQLIQPPSPSGASDSVNDSPAPDLTIDASCTRNSPTGFKVCDDANAKFLSAFQTYGLGNLGHPISTRYRHNGFITQAFQKAILQWRPDGNYVALVNVFDELHNRGFDQRLLETRQTPYQFPDGWDTPGATFAQIRARREGLVNARAAIRRAYFAASDPFTFFGLPTSEVTDMGNHYAIRTQRAVLQEWKETVPWAQAGQVTVANGGDIAKEMGLIPSFALSPDSPIP